QTKAPRGIRLIKGSHLVVRRFHDFPGAFILQNTDRRIVFVLPFQDEFSLIGTTDKEYTGDPSKVSIDSDEINYLLNVVNEHFVAQLKPEDVVHTYSGVRPLCDDESSDPSAITRDYTLELDAPDNTLPLLSIYGGKITTYRKLAESALSHLAPFFPSMGGRWTADRCLPGATLQLKSLRDVRDMLGELYPELPGNLLDRFSRSYGTLAVRLLGNAQRVRDLGEHFGGTLYAREVDYLMREEWVEHPEDLLWRRTKQGLFLNAEQKSQLHAYMLKTQGQTAVARIAS
ncbi:MAG: glycerol-3-phosphate dehydrogenase, partial [Gammaproteobacteria bacterium]|nr:glycerol-3-phosphate dehydrogenase [Gammaproteobacteria bacterium]